MHVFFFVLNNYCIVCAFDGSWWRCVPYCTVVKRTPVPDPSGTVRRCCPAPHIIECIDRVRLKIGNSDQPPRNVQRRWFDASVFRIFVAHQTTSWLRKEFNSLRNSGCASHIHEIARFQPFCSELGEFHNMSLQHCKVLRPSHIERDGYKPYRFPVDIQNQDTEICSRLLFA